jgi:hypothetical protein
MPKKNKDKKGDKKIAKKIAKNLEYIKNLEKECKEQHLDCCAKECVPTDYERGVQAGINEVTQGSILGDINRLEGLQCKLNDALERLERVNLNKHELDLEIHRLSVSICQIQRKVGGTIGYAMRKTPDSEAL